MARLFVLGLWLTSIVFAQLAATSDGSVLDFTSCAALKQEPLSLNRCRVFRHGAQPSIRTPEITGVDITEPYLSSDGAVSGIFGFDEASRLVKLVDSNGSEMIRGDWIAVSRSGRYVASFVRSGGSVTVRDRLTGQRHQSAVTEFSQLIGGVSDQGAVVINKAGVLLHIPFGEQARRIVELSLSRISAGSAKGESVFVLEEYGSGRVPVPGTSALREIETLTGIKRVLYEGGRRIIGMSASDDGSRLLAMGTNELLLWDRASGWRSLVSHDEGFSSSILTGNGKMAFAITGANRYLSINTDTGAFEQLYAPIPEKVYQISGGALPGSVIRFAASPGRSDLQLRIDGSMLPIVKSEAFLDAQIPWEATDYVGRESIAEITAPDSPFAIRTRATFASRVEPWAFTFPEFFGIAKFRENHLVAATEDFSRLIDPRNPIQPGALVHFWLTGLGPLDRPVPTGEPAPVQPIARPLATLNCTISDSRQSLPLEVLDRIYAPNLIGVYQVDIRIPAEWPSSRADIRCASGSSPTTGGLIAIQTAPQ